MQPLASVVGGREEQTSGSDGVRYGATMLCAAVTMATVSVTVTGYPRRRYLEFLRFCARWAGLAPAVSAADHG